MKWRFSDEPVHNQKLSIIRDDNNVIQGRTDASGKTGLQRGVDAESVRLRIED
ncbi:hypothetical protein M3I53_34420 [Paraburkholderia sp. CNPSo 3272]|uniref:hypothetical protein n=1 Tax=Paraburkholderia sp. CNPSo 3272 TaxID=2940931 RepID=UPI0020B67BE6|nr:hypothetical protein [Paraburkholderia sp. CNPSo 3272]MCP3728147.1 hypothetical protein [Paraburkholderia sp. CNPSo 3272]